MTLLYPVRLKDSSTEKSNALRNENFSFSTLNASIGIADISDSLFSKNNQDQFYKILKRCLMVYFILAIAVPFLASWAEKLWQENSISTITEPVEINMAFNPVPTPIPVKQVEPKLPTKSVEKPIEKAPLQPTIVKKVQEPAAKVITPKAAKQPAQTSPNQATAVRQRMQNTGLLAMSNELSDLSKLSGETISPTGTEMKAQTSTETIASASNEIDNITVANRSGSANAGKPSVGVDRLASAGLSSAGFSNPNTKSSTTASSSVSDTGTASKNGLAQDSIRLVFEQNKTAIYSIYHRELRQVPNLKGRVVFNLTIQPDGRVTQAKIISSELNHPALEQKLTQRVTLMRFKPSDAVTTTQYSMDFLANV